MDGPKCNFHFNPRTREGCDSTFPTFSEFMSTFQSTHPRGVRLLIAILSIALVTFQSTHPRGVRPKTRQGASAKKRFQSTHPRGVRLIYIIKAARSRNISIHAPARGATSRAP